MPELPSLAIIIVTWNVRDLSLACLSSVYEDIARDGLHAAVWVVDNASHDGTAEAIRSQFPQATLIASQENLGFAAGNNAALRDMSFPGGTNLPDFVLLLNPDTEVKPGALSAMLAFMQASPGAGIAGARLVYGDGGFQHGVFAFPGLWQLALDLFPFPGRLYESRLNGRYPREWFERGEPFAVDHPLGAAMMVRREAIRQAGLMDEAYHMYCEEIDWALRIKAAGWRSYCVPAAEVVHYEGQSSQQVRPQSIANLWRSRLRLYRRYYGPLKWLLALLIMRAGLNRRIKLIARDSSLDSALQAELVAAYVAVIKASRERS